MQITILAGHYGSGKTTLAVHLAMVLRRDTEDVRLCDLDIVNPYYRAIDKRRALESAGVRLISSPWAGSTVELAGFPPEAASVFDHPQGAAVIDLGGDDRGALALGRYARRLGQYEALLVGNYYRPLTNTPRAAMDICREIEGAGRFRFTGFVNNSNLGASTTAEDVLASKAWAGELCGALGLPLCAVAAHEGIADELAGCVDVPLWRVRLDS